MAKAWGLNIFKNKDHYRSLYLEVELCVLMKTPSLSHPDPEIVTLSHPDPDRHPDYHPDSTQNSDYEGISPPFLSYTQNQLS